MKPVETETTKLILANAIYKAERLLQRLASAVVCCCFRCFLPSVGNELLNDNKWKTSVFPAWRARPALEQIQSMNTSLDRCTVVFSKSEHCKVPQLLSTLVSTPKAYITFSNHSLVNSIRAIPKTVKILDPGQCYQHRLWFQEYLHKKWFFKTLFTHGGKKYRYSWERLLLRFQSRWNCFTGLRQCWSNISGNQQTRHQHGVSKKSLLRS